MKKDYIPVTVTESAAAETGFVEQHWTRVWDAAASATLAEDIRDRDEFRFLDPYLRALPRNSRVLDGGCGLGEWTVYYTSQGLQVVGLDLSRPTIERLKARFSSASFVAGDLRSTTFDDNSFDAYFSWGAFEHFEDGLGAPLREAWRILKPGGHLLITVPFQNLRHTLRDQRRLHRWDECYDPTRGYAAGMRFYQWRLTRPELWREFAVQRFRPLAVEAIHKQRGMVGLVRYDLHLNPDARLGTAIRAVLAPVLPRRWVGHMLLGIAQKQP